MHNEQAVIHALHAIECKHAGLLGSDPSQAEQAKARILARYDDRTTAPDVGEFRFTVRDTWMQVLFCALLKRYGMSAYRYKGQHKSTIMVRASKRFIDEVLQPLFIEMSRRLDEYLDEVTRNVLAQTLAPGRYVLNILPPHDHGQGRLCPACAENASGQSTPTPTGTES